MPDYKRVKECILEVLAQSPLTNREICEKVRVLVPEALSSNSIDCSHTDGGQKEWKHEVRRAIYRLKVQEKIVFNPKNHTYRLTQEKEPVN